MTKRDRAIQEIAEMRAVISDCFERNHAVYWVDLILTVTVGYSMAGIYLQSSLPVPIRFLCFVIAGLALFRAGSFIHEISHMGKGTQRGFKLAWNLLCGIPMVMPSFLYDCHIDHHNVRHYGTRRDGEYLPLGQAPVWYLLAIYWSQVLVLPLLAVFRFAVLTPISFLHPKLRRWVLERASSYVINPWYRRELPSAASRRLWAAADVACSLRVIGMLAVVPLGLFPWTRLLMLYGLGVYVIGLNYVRNMVAHHYRNLGDEMSYADQLDDSINITGHPFWTELIFPLNLRYHALHHLFPGIPYHHLGKAHRKLMATLPPDSPYHRTVYPSFRAALRELWSDMRQAEPNVVTVRAT